MTCAGGGKVSTSVNNSYGKTFQYELVVTKRMLLVWNHKSTMRIEEDHRIEIPMKG